MRDLRKILELLSQASSGRTARTTSSPSNPFTQALYERATRRSPSSSEEDNIKRALGFDPADPNVKVHMVPFPNLGRGMLGGVDLGEATQEDLKKAMQDVYERFAKANGGLVPVSAEDARGLDGDVTGTVTDAAFHNGRGGQPYPNAPATGPEQDPEAAAAEQEEIERQRAGEERWAKQSEEAKDVLQELFEELEHAVTKHAGMNSPHEGISVIREEFEELWDEIKADGGGWDGRARKEALQVAATAIRYVLDLDPSDDTE